jgi:hypothetical protein
MQPDFEWEYTSKGDGRAFTLPLLLPSPHRTTNRFRAPQVVVLEFWVKISWKL